MAPRTRGMTRTTQAMTTILTPIVTTTRPLIVIPTGRGGCCCILPLALLLAPFGVVGIALLARVWRLLRGRVMMGAHPRG